MTLEKSIRYGIVIALTILGFVAVFRLPFAQNAAASVLQGNEYNRFNTAGNDLFGAATTTAISNLYAGLPGLIKSGSGSLAQVTVTGAGAGVVNFYDATTTNKLARTGQTATTSILIASLPASLAAGTYTFDVTFTRGLLVDVIGTFPTTTISYR